MYKKLGPKENYEKFDRMVGNWENQNKIFNIRKKLIIKFLSADHPIKISDLKDAKKDIEIVNMVKMDSVIG